MRLQKQAKQHVLILVMKEGRLLLGESLKGYSKGLLKAVGGEMLKGEPIGKCLTRCLVEQASTEMGSPHLVAVNRYFIGADRNEHIVRVYQMERIGPTFDTAFLKGLSYYTKQEVKNLSSRMFPDDRFWLLKILDGEKLISVFLYEDFKARLPELISQTPFA